ncbi:hypothetical protein ES705_24950 [subsurface metagenome]
MISKMKPEGSRIGIVFNGSPLFTGDAGSGESNIRKWIIESDWLEAIIAMPDQLFYNTGIFTYIWIVTNNKAPERKGKVQLIYGIDFFQKMRKSLGNKRNEISEKQIEEITRIYGEFTENEHCKIFDNEDFGYCKITVERPLKLNFKVVPERIETMREASAFQNLAKSRKKGESGQSEKEAGEKLQGAIIQALNTMDSTKVYRNRDAFEADLLAACNKQGIKLAAPVKKVVINALSERDETADICADAKGNPEPDPELRDYENVPLKEDIHEYFKREVLPHVPDAWIDESKTKIGYEIPLTRHFYKYVPPRPLDDIEADIKEIEKDIVLMINEVAEQRMALITRAVTKGLNPNAPMKDSGVEWLGEIPAHWEVKKLKHVLLRNDGGVWGDDYDENGTIVLRSTEQTIEGEWCIDEPAIRRIDAGEYKKSKLICGDLLITKSSGSELHIGKTTLVTKNIEDMNCCFSNFMQRIRLLSNYSPKYIYYVFNCILGREQLVYYSNTTTGLANLSSTIIGNIHIAIPNYSEQQAITDFLDRETASIDSLIGRINQAIEKLQEYRTTIITAAVTGKIDVRQHVS